MKDEIGNDPDKTFGLSDEEIDRRFTAMVGLVKQEAEIKGLPIQKYDRERRKPYLLYPDGRREYCSE